MSAFGLPPLPTPLRVTPPLGCGARPLGHFAQQCIRCAAAYCRQCGVPCRCR